MLYHEMNCDVVSVAYRGYSASSGVPTEEGLKIDGATVLEYVDSELAEHYIDRGGVFVLGRSLGGAVAAASIAGLSQEKLDKIDGLILENTFTSIPDMADRMFSVLAYFKGLVLTNYWRTIDVVREIELPINYVTSTFDEICPMEMTETLYRASKKSRNLSFWRNNNAGHNDTWIVKKSIY